MKPAELTRQAILDHATDIFAENGFANGSVREITKRASVNQAAINYHFGSKDALYRDVLRLGIAAFSKSQMDSKAIDAMTREEAVRNFIQSQMMPLLEHGRVSRYLRIFAWEAVAPTSVYRNILESDRLPMLEQAEKIVCRFLPPETSRAKITVMTIWLTQQATPFIRYYDMLSKPPLNLTMDETFVESLVEDLGRIAIAGLSSFTRSEAAAQNPAPETKKKRSSQ
jgi:AcrR family transcriptional regulator